MAGISSTDRGRWLTALLLLTGVILMAVGGAVGISDNLPGIALLYAGTLAVIAGLVHRWREPRRFLRLVYGAVIGFVVMVLAHNLAYAVASVTELGWLRGIWEAVSAGALLLAVIVAPAVFVVGGVGALATWAGRARKADG